MNKKKKKLKLISISKFLETHDSKRTFLNEQKS